MRGVKVSVGVLAALAALAALERLFAFFTSDGSPNELLAALVAVTLAGAVALSAFQSALQPDDEPPPRGRSEARDDAGAPPAPPPGA